MRIAAWITALLAAAVLPMGCGGSSSSTEESVGIASETPPPKPRELSVTLDGYAGAENLGILMADQEGYFREAGLKVIIYSPNLPNRPVLYTNEEAVDAGVSREPEVALAQARNVPVVAIGSLVDEPTAALIWLPGSGIESISDLQGKTIATSGLPVQTELLGTVLAGAGLSLDDVTVKNVDYDLVPALVKGRADATFGGGWNLEGEQLKAMGLKPVVNKVQDLGVPPYDEFVVVARRDRLAEDPQLYRDFMAAVVHGAETAVADPNLALEVVNGDFEADFRVSPKGRAAQVEATLPLLSESGEMDPAQAERLVDWMHSEGLLREKIPVSSLLTDEYLPQP